MDKEARGRLKCELLAKSRAGTAVRLRAMGGDPGPHEADSWEGVMTMLSGVMRTRGYDDAAAAFMAAAAWVWAHEEECLRADVARIGELAAPAAPAAAK